MSISQNFPEEGPTLNLNFAGSRTLDPRITFTRTSSATYMGRDGLVKIAPANSARFDHRYNSTTGEVESLGLLVEEARTNLVWPSQFTSFATSATNNIWYTVAAELDPTPNAAQAPDGSTTAALLAINTNIAFRSVLIRTTSVATGILTYSVYCKPASTDTGLRLYIGGEASVTNHVRADFILSGNGTASEASTVGTATAPVAPSITPVGSGWYRCVLYASFTGPTNITCLIYPGTAATQTTASQTLVWGAQLEVGAFPTSYIPTTTSTATRTADTAFIGGSDLKTVFNEIEGSIIANISLPNDISVRGDATAGICGLTRYSPQISGFDGYGLNIRTDTRLFSIGHRVIDESKNVNVSVNGGITESTVLPNQNYKVGFFYSPDLLGLVIGNTSSVSTLSDENYGLYPKTFLYIGRSRNGGSPPYELSGHIAQLTYYPNRLSNSQLITLTK
jgi:hypothetical protein